MWDWLMCENTCISVSLELGRAKPTLDTPAESMQPGLNLPLGLNLTKEPMVRKYLCLVLDHYGYQPVLQCHCLPQSTAGTKYAQPQTHPCTSAQYFSNTKNSRSKCYSKGLMTIVLKTLGIGKKMS